jgi:hypothetical protein
MGWRAEGSNSRNDRRHVVSRLCLRAIAQAMADLMAVQTHGAQPTTKRIPELRTTSGKCQLVNYDTVPPQQRAHFATGEQTRRPRASVPVST